MPADCLRPWTRVLALYAISRVWSLGLLLTWFGLARANGWRLGNVARHADFAAFLAAWDGEYFLRIADVGYTRDLPLDADGFVAGNEWAFLPLFPAAVRALAAGTALPLEIASVVVATLAGAGAAVALFDLVRQRVGDRPAVWTTALFAFGPLSFLLSVGYSESLSALLLFAALGQLVRRRYAAVAVLGILAAFTRPGALALAVAIGVHAIVRLRSRDASFSRRERIGAISAGLLSAMAGLAWPAIAGIVTGRLDAYIETEMAWWANSVGRAPLVPLTPWFRMADAYLGPAGATVVLAAVAAGVGWFCRRSVRRLGPEILGFGASTCAYVFAVFLPQQSLPRILLMPLAPLAADPAVSENRRIRVVLLATSLALQPAAVVLLWSVSFP